MKRTLILILIASMLMSGCNKNIDNIVDESVADSTETSAIVAESSNSVSTPIENDLLTESAPPEESPPTKITIRGKTYNTDLTKLDLSVQSLTDSDIESLKHMTKLTELNLFYNPDISDFSALSELTNLTNLNLSSNEIFDVSFLGSLKKLEVLDLTRANISDISALSSLTNLTHLDLSRTQVTNLNALSCMTNLTTLILHQNHKLTDISALSKLPNLTNLEIRNVIFEQESGFVQNFSVLSGLTNLTHLVLANNSISDISVLSGLTNLTHLSLSANQTEINDISPLKGLTNLIELELYQHPDGSPFVSEAQVDELRAALPNCNIESDY